MAAPEIQGSGEDGHDWNPDVHGATSVLDAFRTAAERVQEADRTLGQKYYSLNIFPPWSPTRKLCRWIVGSERFQFVFLFFAMASCLSSIGGPGNNFDLLSAHELGEKLRSEPADGLWTLVDLSAALVLSFEVIVNVVAHGAYRMRGAYLRTSIFNRIDFVVFLSFWIEQCVVLGVHRSGADADSRFMISLQSFRLLRIFKPLTHFSFFYGVRTIFETLDEGWRHMGVVLSFLLLFLVGFSILTVAFFASSLRRRCVWAHSSAALAGLAAAPTQGECLGPGEWEQRCDLEPVLVQPEQWCGVWEQEGGEVVNSCGPDRLCVLVHNPNCGLASFDHVPSSVLVLFQAVSTDRFPEVLNRCLQSEPHLVVVTVPLFFAVLFTCSQLLVNMFAAVTTERFAKVRERYGAALTAQVWQSQIDYVIDWAHENGYTIAELFERFDVNRNGVVTRQELVHGLAALNLAALPRSKVANLVDQLVGELDMDGDGQLSVVEISVLMEQYEDLRAKTEMLDEDSDADHDEDESSEERAARIMKLHSAVGTEAGGMFVRKHQHKAYASDRSSVYSMSFLNILSGQAHRRLVEHAHNAAAPAPGPAKPALAPPPRRRDSLRGGAAGAVQREASSTLLQRQVSGGGAPASTAALATEEEPLPQSRAPGPDAAAQEDSHARSASPAEANGSRDAAKQGGGLPEEGEHASTAGHREAPEQGAAHRSRDHLRPSHGHGAQGLGASAGEAERAEAGVQREGSGVRGVPRQGSAGAWRGGAPLSSGRSWRQQRRVGHGSPAGKRRRASVSGEEVGQRGSPLQGVEGSRFASLPLRQDGHPPQLGLLALGSLQGRRPRGAEAGGYGLMSGKLGSNGRASSFTRGPSGASSATASVARRGSVRGAWRRAGSAVGISVSRKDSVAGLVAGTKQLQPAPAAIAEKGPTDSNAAKEHLHGLHTFRGAAGRLGRRALRKMTEDELIMYKFGIDEGELLEFRGIFQLLDKDNTGCLDVREIREVYQQLGVPEQKLKKRVIEGVIREVDSDSNGQLDFIEFLVLLLRPEPGSAASKLYPSSELHPTSIQVVCNRVARGRALRVIIFFSIVINIISMAYRDANCHNRCEDALRGIESTFQIVFLVEIIIRVIGDGGLAKFFLNSFNTFDLFIVVLTSAAQLAQWAGAEGASITRALKVMPAFRVLRLMFFSKTFKHLLLFTASSLTSVLNLLLFIVVVLVVFASFGMLLLGNTDTELSAFKDIYHACMTMFQVMTGDDWSLVLYSTMDALHQKHSAAGLIVGSAFITIFYIFATFVVNNLFIAVILESFDLQATQRDANRRSTWFKSLKKWCQKSYQGYLRGSTSKVADEADWLLSASTESKGTKRKGSQAIGSVDEREELILLMESLEAHKDECTLLQATTVLSGVDVASKVQLVENPIQLDPAPAPTLRQKWWAVLTGKPSHELVALSEARKGDEKRASLNSVNSSESMLNSTLLSTTGQATTASSMFLSGSWAGGSFAGAAEEENMSQPRRAIRGVAIRIQEHWAFQRAVLLVILVSCVLLALESPAPDIEAAVDHHTLKAVSDATTICFLFEFLVKVAAFGFLRGEKAYVKSGWNMMDLIVLVLSLMDMFLSGSQLGAARSLRLGRCLKPLRLMRSNPGMRIIVNALAATWKPVLYVLLFSCFFFVCFAIVGMGVFGGRLHRCSQDGLDKVECRGAWLMQPDRLWSGGTELDEWICSDSVELQQGYLAPRVWGTVHWRVAALRVGTFDTFSAAMLTLFQISRLQWVAVMQQGTAVTEEGLAPRVDASYNNAIFFIIWILFSSFFITNLLVALLIDGFNNAAAGQSEQKRIATATRHFAKLVRIASSKVNHDLEAPRLRVCQRIRRVVETWQFEFASTMCVFLNVSLLCFNSVEVLRDPQLSEAMETQNQVFLYLLLAEVCLVMAAYGVPRYFEEGWNVLDFLIVAGGLVAQLLASFSGLSLVARCLRLLRVARLLKKSGSLRTMLNTLWIGLPQILNILLLLFLIVSMFSIFAVQTFGILRAGERISPTAMPGQTNPHAFPGASFTSYPQAMKTLFQVLFGDDWHVMMFDGMAEPPFCTPDGHPELASCGEGCVPSGDCGPGSHASVLFWILFQIVGESIMMNLFIGMVLDCFSKVEAQEASFVNGARLEAIIEVWNKNRLAHGTGMLRVRAVKAFLFNIPRPVGYMNDDGSAELSALDRHALQLIQGELRRKVNKRRQAMQLRAAEGDSWLALPEHQHADSVASASSSVFGSLPSAARAAPGAGAWGWLRWQGRRVVTELFFPKWKNLQLLSEEGGVSFEEVVMTSFYWNCPPMVPNKIKQRRTYEVVHAFLHAEASVIVENMKRLTNRRRSPQPKPQRPLPARSGTHGATEVEAGDDHPVPASGDGEAKGGGRGASALGASEAVQDPGRAVLLPGAVKEAEASSDSYGNRDALVDDFVKEVGAAAAVEPPDNLNTPAGDSMGGGVQQAPRGVGDHALGGSGPPPSQGADSDAPKSGTEGCLPSTEPEAICNTAAHQTDSDYPTEAVYDRKTVESS